MKDYSQSFERSCPDHIKGKKIFLNIYLIFFNKNILTIFLQRKMVKICHFHSILCEVGPGAKNHGRKCERKHPSIETEFPYQILNWTDLSEIL